MLSWRIASLSIPSKAAAIPMKVKPEPVLIPPLLREAYEVSPIVPRDGLPSRVRKVESSTVVLGAPSMRLSANSQTNLPPSPFYYICKEQRPPSYWQGSRSDKNAR